MNVITNLFKISLLSLKELYNNKYSHKLYVWITRQIYPTTLIIELVTGGLYINPTLKALIYPLKIRVPFVIVMIVIKHFVAYI